MALAQAESSAGAAAAQSGATTQPPVTVRSESMRDYYHVFLAFGAAWILIIGYAVSVGRRFQELEEEIRRLRSGT